MSFRRVLAAILLGASLAACGPSAAELAEKQRQEQAAAAALLRAQATEAEQFVRGHTRQLEFTTRGSDGVEYGHNWSIQFTPESWIDASQWRWQETETVAAASGRAALGYHDQLTYNVVPSDLTTDISVAPVDGGWFAVKFECRLSACIGVSGERSIAVIENGYQTGQRRVPISEQRLENSWFFRDRETAERVSIALRQLALHRGAQAPAFQTPPPDASTAAANATSP